MNDSDEKQCNLIGLLVSISVRIHIKITLIYYHGYGLLV